ncbi:2-succinyl-6-hydroxy-2,4-cyclohexadiene-1-carboxylate synthase [Pasteurellaceae bacterium Pebbles2]|nr:2-succinyl-6-hydroxy-2,4-cyclohexadiene-1-carboxylate synthase [Pasteurellaceae bacterium Pebbles2]
MPTLVFLHGLLGTKADWQAVIEKLQKNAPHFHCISLDLPWHGEAKSVEVADFAQCSQYLAEQIQIHCQNQPYILIGYSLGGRLALHYALAAQVEKGNLQGVIVEGANLGLSSEIDKKVRWENDAFWAKRFANEPAESVLEDWYQQAVFAHLNSTQRAALIAKRAANCGENTAKMLLITSLAKQMDFRSALASTTMPIYYLVGEKDQKFRQMAAENQLNYTVIPQAGHNAHSENPECFALELKRFAFEIAKLSL